MVRIECRWVECFRRWRLQQKTSDGRLLTDGTAGRPCRVPCRVTLPGDTGAEADAAVGSGEVAAEDGGRREQIEVDGGGTVRGTNAVCAVGAQTTIDLHAQRRRVRVIYRLHRQQQRNGALQVSPPTPHAPRTCPVSAPPP